jgi:DNA-binding helix-hairpin-helix protein with protein kinase domain
MKPRLYDQAGRRVELGARIGQGGEGAVFEVVGAAERVAKVYYRNPGAEKEAKLLAMARLGTERLLHLTAWPIDTLHLGRDGPVRGLLMPRMSGKPIHLLYGPKSRLTEFREATWAFLLAAAANLARAVAAVHDHGHVIGDINHGNMLVSKAATVVLIDCDSFQVRDGDHLFLCEVGVGPYVPPELQSGSLRVPRTPNHDAFGLAVLIFQLLFLGRHPFSGRFLGRGDLPIEKAIREFRFAYGAAAAAHEMQPPPASLALSDVSLEVAELFEKAFAPAGARESGRPPAAGWIGPLGRLGATLRTCDRNPAHEYWRALAGCPWCRLEAASRTLFFDLSKIRQWPAAVGFDLRRAWDQIIAVPPPGPAPPLPAAALARPSGLAQLQWWILSMGIIMPVFLVLDSVTRPGIGRRLAGGVLVAAVSIFLLVAARRRMGGRVDAAQARVSALRAQWQAEAGGALFSVKLLELQRRRNEYLGLAALRQARREELQADLHRAQLLRFLRLFPLERARIAGLDAGARATLLSYSVETAADVTPAGLLGIPNVPLPAIKRLLSWRVALEQRFRPDPSRGIEAELADLDQELIQLRHRIEQDLAHGAEDLRHLKHHGEHHRTWLRARFDEAAEDLARAEADLRCIKAW